MEFTFLVAWFELIPTSLWTVVRWITFFFKVVSLAFAVPVVGLILFDFSIWLWRAYSPALPADSPRAVLLPDYVQPPSPLATRATSTAIEPDTGPRSAERRVNRI